LPLQRLFRLPLQRPPLLLFGQRRLDAKDFIGRINKAAMRGRF
jgi:hypothetical protein